MTQVRSAVSEILNVEEDLVGLLLNDDASTAGKEEVELLMEAYNSDLKEIQYELANIRNTIEDTNDFINIHLNSIRNRIIKMSLFMEVGDKQTKIRNAALYLIGHFNTLLHLTFNKGAHTYLAIHFH